LDHAQVHGEAPGCVDLRPADARVKAEKLAGPSSTIDPEPTRAEIHTAAATDAAAMDNDSRNNINSSTLPCVFTYDYSRLR